MDILECSLVVSRVVDVKEDSGGWDRWSDVVGL